MKQYMNKFLTIVALLMLTTLGARAEQTVTIVVNPSDGGTVTYGITGGTGGAGGVCTLTATPASGYYLTVENLTAKTTLNGTGMQGRTRTDIEVSNETLVITATNASADPSGETTYTFNMPTDQNINVEVKIITKIDPTDLEQDVFTKMGRGVTELHSIGAYTSEDEHMLYILVSKYEVHQLRQIVRKYDRKAFIIVNEGVWVEGHYLKKL